MSEVETLHCADQSYSATTAHLVVERLPPCVVAECYSQLNEAGHYGTPENVKLYSYRATASHRLVQAIINGSVKVHAR